MNLCNIIFFLINQNILLLWHNYILIWRNKHVQSTQTKNKMANEQKKKLSEEEKNTLIGFYEINKPLWSSDSKFKDKEEKSATRDEMVKLFDQTYWAGFPEKTFHTLRTAFIREHKKIAARQDPIRRNGNFTKNPNFSKKKLINQRNHNLMLMKEKYWLTFLSHTHDCGTTT